jgi:hypothetical protein
MLARQLGLGVPCAFVAATAFGLSGPVLEAVYAGTPVLGTVVWLPGALWAVHRLCTHPDPARACVLSIVLALAFLAGDAQSYLALLHTGLAFGVFGLAFVAPRGARGRAALLAGLAGTIATALVAPALLPALEVAGENARGTTRLTFAEAAAFPASPAQLLWGLMGLTTDLSRGFVCTIATLPLAVLGAWDRPRRVPWLFFVGLTVVTGLFALGDAAGVFRLFYALPLGDLFRIPRRIAFVYALGLCMLAAIGTSGLMTILRGRGRARIATALGWVVASIVLVDVYGRSVMHFALPALTGETRHLPPEVVRHLDDSRGRAFFENFGAHYSSALPYLAGTMNELMVVPTYEPMLPASYAAYFDQGTLWRGFVNAVDYRGPAYFFLVIAEARQLAPGVLARMLDLMSVRHYVTRRSLAGDRLAELERFVGGTSVALGDFVLIERPQALPRAYTVHRTDVVADPAEARARLRDPRTDVRRLALLDRAIEPLGAGDPGADAVHVDVSKPEHVRLTATCASACLLVLTDLHYPGWSATIDGSAADVVRVNTLVRGVRLPAGTHTVDYRYRSRPFRLGLALAGLALVGIAAASIADRRRPRRARPAA